VNDALCSGCFLGRGNLFRGFFGDRGATGSKVGLRRAHGGFGHGAAWVGGANRGRSTGLGAMLVVPFAVAVALIVVWVAVPGTFGEDQEALLAAVAVG
jgi:hypothetical protein